MSRLQSLILSLILLGLATACQRAGEPRAQAETAAAPAPLEVTTTVASEQKVRRALEFTGSLIADDRVTVSSEGEGSLQTLTVEMGSLVRKGQVLAQLENREARLRVDQAEAALKQARARLGLTGEESTVDPTTTSEVRQSRANLTDAKKKYEAAAALHKSGDIADTRYQEALANFQAAEARYQAAQESIRNQVAVVDQRRAELALARKKLTDAVIVAPLDGSVEVKHAAQGEYLRVGTPVVTIVKLDPLRLTVDVPEQFVPEIHAGQEVKLSVDAFPGRIFRGRVKRLNPAANEKARAVTVEATVANSDRALRPGFFARAQFTGRNELTVITVPSKAVVTLAGLSKVFVIVEGKAQERPVKLGNMNGEVIEILDGLSTGERVAITNVEKLNNGVAVTETSAPAQGQ